MYQIDGEKIANGDVKEIQSALFLVNPSAYKALVRKQGHEVKTLADVQDLVDSMRKKEIEIDFYEVMQMIPINAKHFEEAKSRMTISRAAREKAFKLS